jgi:protein-disulfide isomerase
MASCVHRQSNTAFWDLHDALFENQVNISVENLDKFVRDSIRKRSDMDLGEYDQCLTGHGGAKAVREDIAFAMRYNLRSTPTLFINGMQAAGVMQVEDIRALAQSSASKSTLPGESDPRNVKATR